MKNSFKHIEISLPPDIWNPLKLATKQYGITQKKLIRKIIVEWLQQENFLEVLQAPNLRDL